MEYYYLTLFLYAMVNTAASAIKFLSTINTVTYLNLKSPRSPCNCKNQTYQT